MQIQHFSLTYLNHLQQDRANSLTLLFNVHIVCFLCTVSIYQVIYNAEIMIGWWLIIFCCKITLIKRWLTNLTSLLNSYLGLILKKSQIIAKLIPLICSTTMTRNNSSRQETYSTRKNHHSKGNGWNFDVFWCVANVIKRDGYMLLMVNNHSN